MLRNLMVLALALFVLPARAEAPAAQVRAEVSYLGDPGELQTTFSLVDQEGGAVLWSSRNVQTSSTAGVLSLAAPVPDGEWEPSRDIRWCVSVDARRASQPAQILSLNLDTPGKTYGNLRPGRVFQGESARACIRGATHAALR